MTHCISYCPHLCQEVAHQRINFNLLASGSMSMSWRGRTGRWRDLLPLPDPGLCEKARLDTCLRRDDGILGMAVLATIIKALNALGGFCVDCAPESRTAAHSAALARLAGTIARWLQRARARPPPPSATELAARVCDPTTGLDPRIRKIRAAECDLPGIGGNVDPSPYVHKELNDVIHSAESLFPNGTNMLEPPAACHPADVKQYALLVARQLRAHLVRLSTSAHSGARLFGRLKSSGGTRVIFSGAAVSAECTRPPPPRDLGSPASLLKIQVDPGGSLHATKRDGAAMFDQLLLPDWLGPYLSQPSITAAELVRHSDLSQSELADALGRPVSEPSAVRIFPLSATWRMGFAPSSAVCQDLSISVAERAGLLPESRLCDGRPAPSDATVTHLIATDDIVAFTTKGADHSHVLGRALDSALAAHGVKKNPEKDCDAAKDLTIIGIDLCDGKYLIPGMDKMLSLMASTVAVLGATEVAPRSLERHLGIPHWFGQLQRPYYSIFGATYRHTVGEDLDTPQRLSDECRAELAMAALVAVSIEVDVRQQWAPIVLATDATPSYGYGLSMARTSADVVRRIARTACSHDVFVRPLEESIGQPVNEKPRQGRCERLPIPRGTFRTLISARAQYVEHSGTMEATGVTLACRWAGRTAAHHDARLLLLVDAQAVLAATRKGRSSAPTLVRPLRRAAAVCMAARLRLALAYVPSESNPADAPSRGQ